MNTKLGIHVGIKELIPQTEQEVVAYLASIYSWQEWNGPLVLACDEDFYMWAHNFGTEFLYQDIIPLNMEYNGVNDIEKHFRAHTPYDLYFVGLSDRSVMEGNGQTLNLKEYFEQKDFVDLQLELLPEEYKKLIWQ